MVWILNTVTKQSPLRSRSNSVISQYPFERLLSYVKLFSSTHSISPYEVPSGQSNSVISQHPFERLLSYVDLFSSTHSISPYEAPQVGQTLSSVNTHLKDSCPMLNYSRQLTVLVRTRSPQVGQTLSSVNIHLKDSSPMLNYSRQLTV